MNADVYAALLTAGDRLQPVGEWIVGNWMWLTPTAAAVTFAAWAIRRCIRAIRRDNDRVNAWIAACTGDRPELPQPGSDVGLYLDCVAIYADCNDLDRLRDAIDQHRTGESNG